MGNLYLRFSIGSSEVKQVGEEACQSSHKVGRAHLGVSPSPWSWVGSENRDICGATLEKSGLSLKWLQSWLEGGDLRK